MRKTDDKGFSLVELLIAVCILAIIIIPMLNSFLSSYRVNARSRQTLRATTLAQNEMEIFEKESIEALIELDEFAYDEPENPSGYQLVSSSTTDGSYVFKREGIINDESGRAMFDVYIELDPERSEASGRYYDQNTSSVINMSTVSSLDSAIYVQEVQSATNLNDTDTEAYKWFEANKLPTATWTLNTFAAEVEREITVVISQYDMAGKTYTVAKVVYNYSLNRSSIMPSEFFTYTPVQQVIFDNSNRLDDEGNPIELKSVYLFFLPRLNANNSDKIVIENNQGLPVDVYVVRQDVPNMATTDSDDMLQIPQSYQAGLEIHDKLVDGSTLSTYYTNLNIDSAEAVGAGKQIGLKFKDAAIFNDVGNYLRDDVINKTGLVSLYEGTAKDRIYTMTVKVYEYGANINTENALVTLTGTKLE